MGQFVFTSLDSGGRQVVGRLAAQDRDSALRIVSQRYGTLIDLQEVQAPKHARQRRVSTAEVMVVTKELAATLKAGIPLLQSLDVLAADAQTPALRDVLRDLHDAVSEGVSLSEAMEAHPQVFSKLYRHMVAAGEAGAGLPGILARLAHYLGLAESLRDRVKAALYYPAAVFAISFVIGGLLLVFGVGEFKEIYDQMGVALPWATRALIGFTETVTKFWWLAAGLVAAAVLGLRRWLQTDTGQRTRDRLLLTLPVVGSLVQRMSIARFARTLSTLYAAGVPLLPAMELVAGTVGNRTLEEAVRRSLGGLREGQSIVGPLRDSGVFTRMTISMMAAGEESGTLDTMLHEVAEFYEEQVETDLKALVGLLEPVSIVCVGLFVGTILFCLGMPLLGIVRVMM